MSRTTELDLVEPYLAFVRGVDAGVALGPWASDLNDADREVAERTQRMFQRMRESSMSRAFAESGRIAATTDNVVTELQKLGIAYWISASISETAAPARNALVRMQRLADDVAMTEMPAGDGLQTVADLTDDQIDRMITTMSKLGDTHPDAAAATLRRVVAARIRSFNAYVLLGAARRRGSNVVEEPAPPGLPKGRAIELRDRVRALAKRSNDADASWFVEVAGVITTYEREWMAEVGDPVIAALVAASDEAAPIAVKRDAAYAYDATRLGIAWLAGCYQLLIAWAADDESSLRTWASRAQLPLDSGILDLTRTRIQDVVSGMIATGDRVEVAGVVTDVSSERVSGRVRSILRIDDELTVYSPFTAVDQYGILPGVWCAIRGTVLDESKGGYPPPTVRVERRRLGDAAKLGFNEFLEFQGRFMFDRVRVGFDITAARLAHDSRTAREAMEL